MLALAKKELLAKFRKNEQDTGSIAVQVILLTDRIERLTEHFKSHKKDFGSKRGLLLLVGQRRRFLRYIERHNESEYKDIIANLGLRK